MFIRKFLKTNQVDEVNAKGRFIKVMNCEGVFRIRATSQGRVLIDTDATAGFDIQTNEPFDFIEITSDINQKLQLWASEHKLSYDALSVKASRSSSFLALHYGESQQVTAFDSAQFRAQVLSETACWVGGEGVTNLNGIYLPENTKYMHDSAAPLHAYITDKKTYKAVIDSPESIGVSSIEGRGGINHHVSGGVFLHKSTNNRFDTGLIDMSTLQFTRLDDDVQTVWVYEGDMYCVMENKPSSFYIHRIYEGGYTRVVDITLDETISVRCGVFDGLHLYFSGVTQNGYEPSKIYSYNMLTGELLKTDFTVGMAGGGVISMYIDSVTGEHWAVSERHIYRGDFMTAMTLFKSLGSSVSPDSEPTFMQDHIVIQDQDGVSTALMRGDASEVVVNGMVYAMYKLDEKSWVYIDRTGLGTTNDNFTTKEIVYTFEELGAARGNLNSFFMFGDGFFCLLKDASTGKRLFVKFPAIIDQAEPKALFRVFKESF